MHCDRRPQRPAGLAALHLTTHAVPEYRVEVPLGAMASVIPASASARGRATLYRVAKAPTLKSVPQTLKTPPGEPFAFITFTVVPASLGSATLTWDACTGQV